jgi:hypothetical protein
MDSIPCFNCGVYFPASRRHKNQRYCKKPQCQRARKTEWQRLKMKTDKKYWADQKRCQYEWLRANPNYWRDYRRRHPEKVKRNRALQMIRNRRRRKSVETATGRDTALIAKMDASKVNDYKLVGQFWLVPVIAKMDASKIFLCQIPAS